MVFLWVFLNKLTPGWPPQAGSIGPPPPAPRPLPVARCPDRKTYLPGDRPQKKHGLSCMISKGIVPTYLLYIYMFNCIYTSV